MEGRGHAVEPQAGSLRLLVHGVDRFPWHLLLGDAVQGQRDDDVDRIKDLRPEDERQKDEQWQRREGVED